MEDKPKDITFHYTNEQMVEDLITIIPIKNGDSVLDAGSGKNKVWCNKLKEDGRAGVITECEIEDGCDFLEETEKVDWVIGNPPFNISWKFTEKAINIAKVGIAFLVNNQGLNSQMTPRRLQTMKDKGFELKHIRVVADKRWFGRYYFLIFTKEAKGFVSWERKTY